MIEYRAFYAWYRDATKDDDAADSVKVGTDLLARATLAGIRKIQTLFPEARMDLRGRLATVPTTAVNETAAAVQGTSGYPVIPLSDEFEPMLQGYVMAWHYGRDAQDAKDESLAKHWNNRFADLAGVPRL
jgi:hypothetical protein